MVGRALQQQSVPLALNVLWVPTVLVAAPTAPNAILEPTHPRQNELTATIVRADTTQAFLERASAQRVLLEASRPMLE